MRPQTYPPLCLPHLSSPTPYSLILSAARRPRLPPRGPSRYCSSRLGSPSSRCALLLRHTSTPCIPCCLAKVGHGVISWSQVGKPSSPNLQRPIIFIDQPQPLGMAPILPAGSRQVVGAQEATLRSPAPGWGSHYGQVGGGCTASS